MKNIRLFFYQGNFPFLVAKFSIHLNRRVFVMFPNSGCCKLLWQNSMHVHVDDVATSAHMLSFII